MVRVVILISVSVLGVSAWLWLLIATRFAAVTVSIGLLGVVYVTGMSAGPHRAARRMNRTDESVQLDLAELAEDG